MRSVTGHTGGSLKIPIGFADDDDDDDGDDLDFDFGDDDDLIDRDNETKKTSTSSSVLSTPRNAVGSPGGRTRVGTGAMGHFGRKEVKHSSYRDTSFIRKDRKVADGALREISHDDSAEESNSLDTQYENEIKQNHLSGRSNGSAASSSRSPVLNIFSGSAKKIADDEDDGEAPYKFHVKFLLLGDSNVGKSCVLTRYADDRFVNSLIPTTGVDFKTRFVATDEGEKIKCQVWDTAGQERFRMITRAYYRGTHGIVLVYDVTDRQSFEHIQDWMCAIREYSDKGVLGCVFCNKTDLPEDSHVVTRKEGEAIAKALDFEFYETSAKTGKNIKDSLDRLAKKVVATGHVKALLPVYAANDSPSPEKGPRRHEKYRTNTKKKQNCILQ